MHTIELPESNVRRYMPSDLSECDSQQYMDMCELMFHYQNGSINYEEFRTHAVYKLLNMKAATVKADDQQSDNKFSNIYMISELIDDFFDIDSEGKKVIKQDYIHNPVPKFAPLQTTFYGPANGFRDMTFGEYRDGLRLFHDFHATGDVYILTLLTAVFYRHKKYFNWFRKKLPNYDGNIRERYNSNTLELRATAFKHSPIGFVYGFYLLFASFQKYIVDAKILWGGNEIDFSILFNGSKGENSSSEMPGIGMDSIAFSLAESGTFGTIREVDNTNFWEIFTSMYDFRRTELENQKRQANVTN